MKSFKGAFLAAILMLMSFAAQATLVTATFVGQASGINDDLNLTGVPNNSGRVVPLIGEFTFDTTGGKFFKDPFQNYQSVDSTAPYYLKYTLNNRTFDGLIGPDVGQIGDGFLDIWNTSGNNLRVQNRYRSHDQTYSVQIDNYLTVNFVNDSPVPNPVSFSDYYTNQSSANLTTIGTGAFSLTLYDEVIGYYGTSFNIDIYSFTFNPVPTPAELPEPSTTMLMALAGLLVVRSVIVS